MRIWVLGLVASILVPSETVAATDTDLLSADVRFARPIHDPGNLNSKMTADIIQRNIEDYSSEKKYGWQALPYSLGTEITQAFQQTPKHKAIECLPDTLFSKIKTLGGKYLVILYHVNGIRMDEEKGMIYYPIYGGIARIDANRVDGNALDDEYDQFSFAYSVISLDSNRAIYSKELTTTLCEDGAYQCVASVLFDDISSIGHGKTLNGTGLLSLSARQTLTQTLEGSSGLFVLGSVLSFSGFGILVSGNSDAAKSLGATLFITGECGLLICGLSNSIINSALKKQTGQAVSGGAVAWIFQGASLASLGAGMAMVSSGFEDDNFALIMSGLAFTYTGLVASPLSWILHLRHRRKMSRMINKITLAPRLSIDLTHTKTIVGLNIVF